MSPRRGYGVVPGDLRRRQRHGGSLPEVWSGPVRHRRGLGRCPVGQERGLGRRTHRPFPLVSPTESAVSSRDPIPGKRGGDQPK